MSLLSIKIAGPAGFGIKSGGLLISNLFQKSGFYFTDYSEYPSLVRGGHNTYQATVSLKPIHFVSKNIDIFFCLKTGHLNNHLSEFHSNTLVFSPDTINTKKFIPIKLDYPVRANVYCYAIIVFLTQANKTLALNLLKSTYQQDFPENQEVFDKGFQFAKTHLLKYQKLFRLKFQKQKTDNLINLDGNQSFAYGFYKSSGKFYAAYPMTPATGALHTLAQNQSKWGIIVIHPEDEIGAASMAIGASYAGLPSAVGTSGGGFALMTETVSFCGVAEIGLLFYVVSRPGPATGLPTWTSQSDLLFSIFSGHGDFIKVVLAPSDQKQSFDLAINALNISQQFQIPVIFLSDKMIAESNASLPDFNKEEVKKYLHKKYLPGTEDIPYLANSYEHDLNGFSTEDPKIIQKMAKSRLKQYNQIIKYIPKPILYKNNGKNLIISWGSPVSSIRQAFNFGLKGYDLLQVTTLWPLDPKIKKITSSYKKVICLENNQFGHLNFLLKTIGVNSDRLLTKFDGRPFFPEEIIKSLSLRGLK